MVGLLECKNFLYIICIIDPNIGLRHAEPPCVSLHENIKEETVLG